MANEKATGPTALAQILHDRSLRLAAGLAVAVAIPVAVLFYFQFRSLNAIEETSSVVLRQLSKDTADSLTRTIDESLKSVQIRVFLRITAARVEPLDLAFIEPVFVQNLEASPFAEAFYVYSEVTPPRYAGRLLVVDRKTPVPSEIPISGRFREDPDAAAVLVPLIKELALQRRAIVLFKTTLEGREKYIQVQVRWNNAARDVMTSFLAVAVDAERLRTDYFPALLRSELSGISGPTGFPPLVATVVDERSRIVFDSGTEPPTTGFLHERSFPVVFFDRELLEFAAPYEANRDIWRLRVGYGNRGINEIVAASTQPQKALLATLALALGFGVFFVARAAAREVRLAELKSNFVSSVSHDLKTPLALIQLFAETLELGRLKSTERAMEYYRIINSEARKLTRLIDNILDFSKMEAGLRPYKVGRQDLAGIAEHVLGALQSQFTLNHFQVRFEQAGAVPPVLVDADAVKQAIENLLTNAMKYSGESREIVVRVGTERGFASVAVTDRGIGIARRHQRLIFRKFYRIEADAVTGLTGPQGCGLGLAIVDHTMRGHGGHVRVESEPDHGSTFTLCFPIPSGAPTNEAHTGDRGRAADAARTA